MLDDDEIIADGLSQIAEGIVCGNWKIVCNGYNSISGQDLQPPIIESPEPKKTKLELVREKLAAKTKPIKVKKPPGKKKEKVTEILVPDEIPVSALVSTKQTGGKKFGMGEVVVFSTMIDEDEKNRREEEAKKKMVVPRQPFNPDLKIMSNPDGDVHIDMSNRKMK